MANIKKQQLSLPPVKRRFEAISSAGNNTFLLQNRDIFLDMLTDSGVNAMSDRQQAAMFIADDSYAGSETFIRLEKKMHDLFGYEFFLPAHQGRACEHILAQVLVQPGMVVPMNVHFTTTKAHISLRGGRDPFKGNLDVGQLEALIQREGAKNTAFVRMEAGGNLIGGQPFSLENLRKLGSARGGA